ncbi:ribonuclease H-like domain-containing protein [Tanacetum coccineum]
MGRGTWYYSLGVSSIIDAFVRFGRYLRLQIVRVICEEFVDLKLAIRQDLGFIPSGNVVLSSTYVGKILGADQLLVILCYRYQESGIGYWILSMTISGSGKFSVSTPLCYDDIHDVTPRVSALAGCDTKGDELKFNILSVLQMCDKKNSVLFTESECLILSPSFKLLDESQAVLRAPRKDDVYSLDLKNIVPSRGLEKQLNHNVKIIRCDNGTEFKNYVMNEFCTKKGIKREFSVARTPQQNVNTACYVLNRVLVTKSQNKTPYELLIGKFNGKSDEGYLLGYSTSSRAFRVYNKRTKRVEENLHISFLEDQPNVAGTGPNWMFDLDFLTNSMNYIPVILATIFTPYVSTASTPIGANAGESSFIYLGGKIPINASTLPNADLPINPNMPDIGKNASNYYLQMDGYVMSYDDDEDVGAVADFNNMDNTIAVRKKVMGTKLAQVVRGMERIFSCGKQSTAL